MSEISADLCSLGIPKDRILQYEIAFKTGKFVVIIHRTAEEATHARSIINHTNLDMLEIHDFHHPSIVGTAAQY